MTPLSSRPQQFAAFLRVQRQLIQLFERETRDNPRIHLGILAIAAILLIGFWFRIDDSHRRAASDIAAGESQTAGLRRLADQKDWTARLKSVQGLRAQLENRLWEADSDGLAQADFQDLITELAKQATIQHLDSHVEIVGVTPESQSFRQMSATVSGVFNPDTMQKFLAGLDSDKHLLVVDRLRIETMPIPRFEMLLSTFLRPGAEARPARS
jgi:Type II secretion system (T2SS), protein M subtype b